MKSAETSDEIVVSLIGDAISLEAAFAIRTKVFVDEQNVPESEELDEFEGISRHFICYVGKIACGTARWRITPEGNIKLERFAVLKEFRGKGIGARLIRAVLADLPPGYLVYLHGQIQVLPLYKEFGFVESGPEFDECGIMHKKMILSQALPE